MTQCRGFSCKNSPLDNSVLERFDDTFVEKLSLNDNSSLPRSHAKREHGTENFVPPPKSKETDQVYLPEIDTSSHGNTLKSYPLEEVKELRTTKTEKLTSAVAFSIPVGDSTCTTSHPPMRLLASAKQHKKQTIESLNDKQILAEKRRKQQRDRRLQRIHARQEAARKLAEKVEVLLQQRALAMGMSDGNIKRMPSSQLLATANQVAHNFRDLTNQLDDDFAVKGAQKTQGKCPQQQTQGKCPQKQTKKNSCPRREDTPQSVYFTVDVPNEEKTPTKKPVPLAKQQRKVMTVEELEEKQRRAEERRNKRIERRVTRCKENREALMNMAKDIENIKNLQSSSPAGLTQTKETVLLAERIADGFDNLWHRYDEDLRRADNFHIDQPYVMGP